MNGLPNPLVLSSNLLSPTMIVHGVLEYWVIGYESLGYSLIVQSGYRGSFSSI